MQSEAILRPQGAILGSSITILGHFCFFVCDHPWLAWEDFWVSWGRRQGSMPNSMRVAHSFSSYTSSGAILSHFRSILTRLRGPQVPKTLKQKLFDFSEKCGLMSFWTSWALSWSTLVNFGGLLGHQELTAKFACCNLGPKWGPKITKTEIKSPKKRKP